MQSNNKVASHPSCLFPCVWLYHLCSTRHDLRTDHEELKHLHLQCNLYCIMTNRIRHSSKPVRSNTSRKRIEQADQQPGQPSEPTNPPRYSTREITWEEQKSLGGDFKKVGKGSWPAAGIIDERIIRKRKQYLVDWESHPLTLEVFPPTWVRWRTVICSSLC